MGMKHPLSWALQAGELLALEGLSGFSALFQLLGASSQSQRASPIAAEHLLRGPGHMILGSLECELVCSPNCVVSLGPV